MSVSSQLTDPSSPLARFLAGAFPNTRSFIARLNRQLSENPLLDPPAPGPSYDYGLVGTALDYRIRFYFDERGVTKDYLVAELGAAKAQAFIARTIGGEPDAVMATCDSFFQQLRRTIRDIGTVGRRLDQVDEDAVGRCCLALALFDACFRTAIRIDFPIIGPLLKYDHAGILALVRSESLDDLRQLSWRFIDTQAALLERRPLHLNPVFAGSHDVEGADADLIVAGDIIDITSTRRPLAREKLLEVLAYVLLDYDDEYAIQGAGLYVARRGALPRWELQDLLAELAGPRVRLSSLRKSLRKALSN